MPQKLLTIHGTVILAGSSLGLKEARTELEREYKVHHYRDNAMYVEDVADSEMPQLKRLADAHGVWIEQVRDTQEVRVATDKPKAVNLNLLSGGWYKTNQDAFPLINIIEIRNVPGDDGEELWLFDVDLVDGTALPQPATMNAKQLKSYKPKPASLDDFEKLDIAPPAGFEPAPHAIPNADDDLEDWEKSKKKLTEGVTLPKAQIAVMALRQAVGPRLLDHRFEPVASGGVYIRASVVGNQENLPEEIAGTAVRYE